MEPNTLTDKIIGTLKKYRYALLVLMIGIVLMNLPIPKKEKQPVMAGEPEVHAQPLEEKLEDILKHMEGVGNAKVLLTIGQGQVIHYQENSDESTSSDSTNLKREVVTVTDGARNEKGLIKRKDSEVYRGAMILCQGAEKPSVRLNVIEAVSKVTGLSTDRICVLKME